jgi:hypothetical protein
VAGAALAPATAARPLARQRAGVIGFVMAAG